MSVKVTAYIWEHSQQTGSDLLMLLAIADHANDDGLCWPSIERLAHKCRVKERQAKNIIAKLIAQGEITVERGQGRGHTSHYRIKGATEYTFCQKKVQPSAPLPEEKVQPSAPIYERKGAIQYQEKVQSSTTLYKEDPSLEPSEEKKEDSLPPVESVPQPFTPLDLLALYNTEAPAHCPRARALTPDREKKARACLKLFPDETFWREVFAQAQQSPLLRGETVSSTHPNWRADFMWFVGKGKDGTENCLKVVEGKYADHPLDGVLSAKGQRSVANAQRILQEQRHGHDGAGFLALLPEPHRAR